MIARRKRQIFLAAVFTLSILVAGTWWLSSQHKAPADQQLAAGSAPAGMEVTGTSGPANPGPIKPFHVDLATIAPGQFDPHNKFDRWLNGDVDFSKRRRLIDPERFKALRAASPLLPPSLGVQVIDDIDGPAAPEPDPNDPAGEIDSIDYTQCCGVGGNVPPDPEMAAGPDHLIAVVNVAFEIYDKTTGVSTTAGIPTTFESFMNPNDDNPSCTNVFDPNVLYDEDADRFILGVATSGGFYCIAVSQTGDPTAYWNIYALPTYVGPGPEFFDFPHAGVGEDAIYVGANIFKARTFKEGRIFALDKAEMYEGIPAHFRVRSLGSAYDTPQPLNLHGADQGTWPDTGKHHFISDKNFNGRTYAIHSWLDPFGANVFTEVGVVDLNDFTGVTAGLPINVPQLGGGTVDGGDWRPQDFEYRNGYGWTVMTIACNPGGTGTVNCVRWAKINLADATVADAGVYAGKRTYRSYADLAANACDDMAVGYTKSGPEMYPAIWYTGRQHGDALGLLQDETLLKAGEITYTSFETSSTRRWGDYTGMTIDPDGKTFWYLGEYSKITGNPNGHWGTYIGSFSYNCDPTTPSSNTDPVAVNDGDPVGIPVDEGTNVEIFVLTNDSDADGDTLNITSVTQGANGSVTITGGGTTVSYNHNGSEAPLLDSFTYTIGDGHGGNDTATVFIAVTPVNDAPVVTISSPTTDISVVEGTEVSFAATATDAEDDDTTLTTGIAWSSDIDGAVSANSSFSTSGLSLGTHIIAASVTDAGGLPGADSVQVVVTVTPQPGGDMHVGDLDGTSEPGRRSNKWDVTVTIEMHGSDESPVQGATVNGSWGGGAKGSGSCITNASGRCDVGKSNIKTSATTATFAVTDVTHATLSYDNTVNDGLLGTSPAITVNRP